MRLLWLPVDNAGPRAVVVVMVIVTEVLNPDDIVVTMMGMTVDLWLMSVVAVVVESGLMAIMPLGRRGRHLNDSWVMMESLKLLVRNGMHESLLFHFMRSSAVPYLPLCEPSGMWPGYPLVGVPSVTSDKVETLTTRLIPGSRAPFFDIDVANDLGPAHCMRLSFGEGERREWERGENGLWR